MLPMGSKATPRGTKAAPSASKATATSSKPSLSLRLIDEEHEREEGENRDLMREKKTWTDKNQMVKKKMKYLALGIINRRARFNI